jgi:hypothetical protein
MQLQKLEDWPEKMVSLETFVQTVEVVKWLEMGLV